MKCIWNLVRFGEIKMRFFEETLIQIEERKKNNNINLTTGIELPKLD